MRFLLFPIFLLVPLFTSLVTTAVPTFLRETPWTSLCFIKFASPVS
jgi:hypothetical protein